MQMRRASPSMIASKLHSSGSPTNEGQRSPSICTCAGSYAQPEQRAPHRQVSRLQDVQRIDFLDVGPGDRPGNRRAADLDRELGALLRLDHLGIADAADAPPRIEDDRGRDDRSRQRPAPSLIDARAQAVANQIERQLCRTHRSPSNRASRTPASIREWLPPHARSRHGAASRGWMRKFARADRDRHAPIASAPPDRARRRAPRR